jgi:hypothetical protein
VRNRTKWPPGGFGKHMALEKTIKYVPQVPLRCRQSSEKRCKARATDSLETVVSQDRFSQSGDDPEDPGHAPCAYGEQKKARL